MEQDIDPAVSAVLSDDLEHASEAEILQRLDAEIQRQMDSDSGLLSAEQQPAWAAAGGIGSTAQRFLTFYADALHHEICDPEKRRLKDQYRNIMSSQDTSSQLKALIPMVLTAIGVGASFVNPAAIAALVALWLIRTGLDQWCATPRVNASPTQTVAGGADRATGSGAEVTPAD